ncbi:MAG: ABC transporter ATP-binding protein [Clostridiales Family XIII bacterium]|jgi:oligopeptide/dipeptide ABC transporter ATP-binding protein|nr:ABC transporter ATP-binding protein [Clostridiales Family XIII bacterium]
MNRLLWVEDLSGHIDTPKGRLHILNGVSFCVHENECFGIIGESGSGKTMTALSVLRYAERLGFQIDAGAIVFEGEDVLGFNKRRLLHYNGGRVAVIPQDPMTSLDPLFTAESQLVETLRTHKKLTVKQAKAQAYAIAEKMRIAPEKLKCYPFQLSGGMLQRIVGAAAIACHPKMIIADEPTTALDVTVQLQYLKLLRDIQDEYGAAIVFISHDMHAVSMICDRIAVMYAGRIVECASKNGLLRNPRHPYTRALIRSANLSGEVRGKYDTIDGVPPDPLAKPVGCSFADRCPHSMPRCFAETPPKTTRDDHEVCCWACQKDESKT